MNCNNCGAPLSVGDWNCTAKCEYCGTIHYVVPHPGSYVKREDVDICFKTNIKPFHIDEEQVEYLIKEIERGFNG